MASKKPGNEGGIKNLFSQHVEKMALGVAVVMVFTFLYFGMRHKPLGANREAVALERAVKSAKDNLQLSTWDQIWRLKEWPDARWHLIAEEDAVTVDPKAYQISWLRPPVWGTLEPRVDPQLMPVEKLEVRPGVIAALAYADGGGGRGGLAPPRRGGGAAGLLGGDEEEDDSTPPTLSQEQIDALDKGYRPKGRNAQAVGKAFVCVRGVVPVVDQQAEYDRCFARAMKDENHAKYAADRDRPNYIYAYIERQEVGDDGKPVAVGTKDGQPQYWTRMAMSARIAQTVAEPWPEVAEPADPRYVDKNLTMPPLPVLLQDYVALVMHSDVPLEKDKKQAGEAAPEEIPAEGPGAGPEFGPGGLGPGAIGGPGGTIDDKTPPKDAAAAKTTERPAEYRLFRYYDFNVDPLKRYRYRVQLLLEDPNNPLDPAQAPDPRTLEGDVIARIDALPERANGRVYWRETAWSEETAIVDFPPMRRVLAGEVDAGRTVAVSGYRAPIRISEPEATVMALVWDADQAVWVPGIAKELVHGSFVDFAANVWVVDPVSFEVRRLSAYPFDTGYTVADIYGGELLPSDNRKSKLTVPGEVLLFGQDGRVDARSEYDDADSYALFHYTSGGGGSSTPARSTRPGRDEGGRDGHSFEHDLLDGG